MVRIFLKPEQGKEKIIRMSLVVAIYMTAYNKNWVASGCVYGLYQTSVTQSFKDDYTLFNQ